MKKGYNVSLNQEEFEKFKVKCKDNGIVVSHCIDRIVKAFNQDGILFTNEIDSEAIKVNDQLVNMVGVLNKAIDNLGVGNKEDVAEDDEWGN